MLSSPFLDFHFLMPEITKLQSAEFNFAGSTFCLMRQSVDDNNYILYMEDNGKWVEMNWHSFLSNNKILFLY